MKFGYVFTVSTPYLRAKYYDHMLDTFYRDT